MSYKALEIKSRKDRKILQCWKRGIEDPKIIAKKIGYSGDALTSGIERVKEGLDNLRNAKHI